MKFIKFYSRDKDSFTGFPIGFPWLKSKKYPGFYAINFRTTKDKGFGIWLNHRPRTLMIGLVWVVEIDLILDIFGHKKSGYKTK